jgi:hypothetical protein
VLLLAVGWFFAELLMSGERVGLAERVAAGAQAMWRVAGGELADGAYDCVEGHRLDRRGQRPSTDEEQGCGEGGDQTPPRHPTHDATLLD